MKKLLSIGTLLCIFSFFVCATAQEATATTDTARLEEDLFGGDEDTLVSEEDTRSDTAGSGLKFKTDLKNATLALESNKLRIGGGLDASLKLNYLWEDPYSTKTNYGTSFLSANGLLKTQLDANLFFDARPSENLKLYGKFLFGFPFEHQLSGALTVPKTVSPNGTLPMSVNGSPNIKIHELYTDFSAKDIAFFRFGKHTVKWGTGYFYSPADVINLSRIDPQDPEAEREGSVSLRTHIIIPNTQHNIWLYVLPPMEKDKFKPEYTAGAAKAELVFGNWEWGIGGWYKYQKAPRFITTLSGSIAGKVAVFAEGVFAWGSDYTYYKNDAAFTAYQYKNKPFFQATAGCSYSNTNTHTTVAFQYFYNGFGYQNPVAATAILAQAVAALKAGNITDPSLMPAEQIKAMGNIGQHYIAFTIAQNKLGIDKLSLHLFQQFAISEREGRTNLTLRWNIYKPVSMSCGPSFTYPLSPSSQSKGTAGFTLGFTLGGGKF